MQDAICALIWLGFYSGWRWLAAVASDGELVKSHGMQRFSPRNWRGVRSPSLQRRTPRHPRAAGGVVDWIILPGAASKKLLTALFWCLGGIVVSFLADLACPESVAGTFAVGRWLCGTAH